MITPFDTFSLMLADGDTGSIVGWSILLVILLLVMFGGIGFLRKWMAKDEEPTSRLGFTLGDLRRLHQEGSMTDEEFEKAREQMIAATKRAAERDAQQALEALKNGGKAVTVTDIEELRSRAKRHRDSGANPEGSGDEGTPGEV